MRSVTVRQRRAALVARHHLAGGAPDARAVVEALVALHASDPATVYLSVLARSHAASVADLAAEMYDRRTLVRWMAMRRTLFVVARGDVPTIQAAVSTPLAGVLRRRLLAQVDRTGIDPPVDQDLADWVGTVEEQVEQALARRGDATGAELRDDVPALRARILPGTPAAKAQGLTSPLLTLMSAQGRLVRGAAVGAWTSRNHRWEPAATWWPDGVPHLDPPAAQADLARRWLERYGPATVDDLQWWTGWSRATTRHALSCLDTEEVDLHGQPGVDLAGAEPPGPAEPVACLLPALDPTPMGWKHRGWSTDVDTAPLYDTAGNIGPTVWWDGELVGGWASTPTGIRTRLLADRGRRAAAAVEAAARHLGQRLDGATVTPAARTPLERQLSA